MDLEGAPPPLAGMANCCECGCNHCSSKEHSSSGTWLRSVKRKLDEFEEGSYRLVIPDFNFPHVAKVELGNECVALREMVSNQQKAIDDLLLELDEERNASSSAANEAMSMILRLQREKADIQMEARQFKRFVEEKMAHDQEELFAMEDLLYKREQSIQSLTCEVQAYKHRMMSYGLSEAEAEGAVMTRNNSGVETMSQNYNFIGNIPNNSFVGNMTCTNDVAENMTRNNSMGGNTMSRNNSGVGNMTRNNSVVENLDVLYEFPTHEYPPLKCNLNENQAYLEEPDNETVDIEKYAFGETPQSRDHLKDLEYRINQLESTPRENQSERGDVFGTKNVLEKVIVGHSPRQRPKHFRGISTESTSSFFATIKETGSDGTSESPKVVGTAKKMDSVHMDDYSHLRKVDDASEIGDDMSDRVYTIDSVHTGVPYQGVNEPKASMGVSEDYMSTPRGSLIQEDIGDPEIKKLYTRLQALEADRESMRQALISMRTDKAQLVLLKEIAQHLCKEMSPARNLPVKKASITRVFSFFSVFKVVYFIILLLSNRIACF